MIYRGYTPGPWETDSAEHDEPYLPIVIRPVGRPHRTIVKVYVDDAPEPDFNAEQRANARLIASAPDLLLEIERLRERLANLEAQAVADIAPGWVCIPAVEWEANMSVFTPPPNCTDKGSCSSHGACQYIGVGCGASHAAERPKPLDDKSSPDKSELDFGHGTMEGREVRR